MAKSLYVFAEVEAKTASPQTLNMIVRDVLRADDGICYAEMERYLRPPGVSGSRQFDQAYAVDVLMKHDATTGGRIASAVESTGLTRRELWDRLVSVLRSVGFRIQHGRLTGLRLEDKRKNGEEDDDSGQPDID